MGFCSPPSKINDLSASESIFARYRPVIMLIIVLTIQMINLLLRLVVYVKTMTLIKFSFSCVMEDVSSVLHEVRIRRIESRDADVVRCITDPQVLHRKGLT